MRRGDVWGGFGQGFVCVEVKAVIIHFSGQEVDVGRDGFDSCDREGVEQGFLIEVVALVVEIYGRVAAFAAQLLCEVSYQRLAAFFTDMVGRDRYRNFAVVFVKPVLIGNL